MSRKESRKLAWDRFRKKYLCGIEDEDSLFRATFFAGLRSGERTKRRTKAKRK